MSETDWEFLLATTTKPLTYLIWVREDEICHYDQSHIINPIGEF
ncbi:hypothetical protein H1P_6560001 [Hyella patelloides LEGE 07179]|uniref:Uncharacterized protein n=1 Tax=Hyella patelloides LEGE 07179 TaxID=945734 RepID=A0A563W2Q0_9CYAN|nr:hypothetical protein H1P_6560001 [Hyella patelloides LEGE 07179]